MRRFPLLAGGIVLLFLCLACQPHTPAEPLHLSGPTMGTSWSVSYRPASGSPAPASLQRLLQEQLDRVNSLMSTYDPASELSLFNQSTGTDWFPVSSETATVIDLAQQISRLTDGAFDVSVGPLVELWGFGAQPRGERAPSAEQVSALLTRVGYAKIEVRLEPPAVRKSDPLLRIDLSAIAKGYAVDLLAEQLAALGIGDYLVEVGGEMRLAGVRGDGTPWKIAIEKPLDEVREVEAVFALTGTAVATSGNYRNFYEEDGQRYVHTIDPVSGRPIRHRLASVTVIDPSCARADALATALMVMGEERGRRFCEAHGVAAFFLVYEQSGLQRFSSSAFQSFSHEMVK